MRGKSTINLQIRQYFQQKKYSEKNAQKIGKTNLGIKFGETI